MASPRKTTIKDWPRIYQRLKKMRLAHDDERIHPESVHHALRLVDHLGGHHGALAGADFGNKMAAVGRADDGAAKRHDAIGAVPVENHVIARREQPFEAILEPDDNPAQFLRRERDSAQHGIQAGAVASTG